MSTLTITAKGQVTCRKDVLLHLGVTPGKKLEVTKLPNGQLTVRAERAVGNINNFFGCLRDPAGSVLSIESMNEVIAAGWAGTL